MINCTPEVMSLPIYLHKDFIKVPLTVAWLHTPCSSLFNLAGELRAKPMPPVPDRFIAYIYATFMKKVFHIPQRERKSHIQHNCKFDNLRAGFEVAEWKLIGHSWVASYRGSPQQGRLFWQGPLNHCLSMIYLDFMADRQGNSSTS